MFEPKVITKFDLPRVIDTNLAELEPVIAEKEALATSLVVTADKGEVARADADAADIRKMQERIKRFRIDFVDWWKKPLDGVEALCKDYEKRLDKAYSDLHGKTEEIKDAWREAKRDELWAMLENRLGELADEEARNSPYWQGWFAEMTDPKTRGNWLNKGITLDEAERQISDEILRVAMLIANVGAAMSGESQPVRSVAMQRLYRDFDMTAAMSAVAEYKAQQERIARDAQAEAERRSRTPTPAPTPAKKREVHEPIDLLTFRLAVTGSIASLRGMKAWCAQHGITIVNLDRVGKAN